MELCYEREYARELLDNKEYYNLISYIKTHINDNNAICDMGYCYYLGIGVREDINQAIELFDLSAKQGNIEAQANLGICYFCGDKITQDIEKAIKLFKEA